MKTRQLSYAQACAIQNDYQYLIGEPFDYDYRIDMIMVVPKNRISQRQYVLDTIHRKDVSIQLYENLNEGWDVVLVSRSGYPAPGFRTKDLRSYLAETGTFYNAARYEGSQHTLIPFPDRYGYVHLSTPQPHIQVHI